MKRDYMRARVMITCKSLLHLHVAHKLKVDMICRSSSVATSTGVWPLIVCAVLRCQQHSLIRSRKVTLFKWG